MKTSRGIKRAAQLACVALALNSTATASTYGTLNNFDPGTWQNSTLPVTDNGGQHHVTPNPAVDKFFRLNLP